MNIKINFIIGELSSQELETLKNGYSVISKMILTPEDYQLFQYKEGDNIQIQTSDGNRLWCLIEHIEIFKDEERVILIFTLAKASS